MRRPLTRGAGRALAAVALVLLAACGGNGDEVDITGVDAASLLVEAADRLEQVQSFHFVLEHEGGATEIVRGVLMERAEGDVAGSDRIRVEIEGSLININIKTGIVVIGEQSWFRNPLTARWERQEISLADVFDPATGVTGLMRSARDPLITGTKKIDGVQTYVVETIVDSDDITLFGEPTPGRELVATAWIGVDEPLVYRIELVGAITAAEEEGLVRRLTLSRFDEDIDITPPR